MIHFLISLVPVCLGIWCIHILFEKDHLFEKQGTWLVDKIGKKWTKPIFRCPICMSSLWGLIGFLAIRYFFNMDLPWKQIAPFVFCQCGLNTIIAKLTNKERIILDE